jgi:hypothetical protein
VIRGRVVDDRTGEPLPSALVRIHADRPGRVDHLSDFGYAITGADGGFTFQGLQEGSYALVADDQLVPSGAERIGGRVDGIRVAAGEPPSDVVLRARRAAGLVVRVTDELGAPLSRALVFAVDAVGKPFGALPVAFTGDDGKALLAGLPTGSMRVLARAAGFAPGFSGEHRAVAGLEDAAEVMLQRGTRVVATVRDGEGRALEPVLISARRAGEPWIGAAVLGRKRTAGGEHDLGALRPGSWEFAITDALGRTTTVEREIAGGSRVALVLEVPARER